MAYPMESPCDPQKSETDGLLTELYDYFELDRSSRIDRILLKSPFRGAA